MMHRRQRVLFHPFYFLAEEWNGIDEHLLLLSKHLDRRRYEIIVLTHESDGPQTMLLAKRAEIRAVASPYPSGASAATRHARLRSLYAEQQVDLVHFHRPVAGGQASPARAARLAGVSATVATYHQVQPNRLPAKSRIVNAVTQRCMIEDIIAVSAGVKASLGAAAGLDNRRIQVVHNGVDDIPDGTISGDLPERVEGEIRIGYFGRLSPEKGVSCLLDGMALLAAGHPEARLLIAGDGPERAELEARAIRLGIVHRVRFLGFRSDARRLMAQVDIVAHVPVYEGFGIVAIEAMACHRPVVANDAPGGLSEIVLDGETGLIVPSSSPSAVAEAIGRLIADPEERDRLGRNGRARFEQEFSARQMTTRTAAIYEHALNRRVRSDRRSRPAAVQTPTH
jgi:glycosyltransferase involved in cell wall biosynthesis